MFIISCLKSLSLAVGFKLLLAGCGFRLSCGWGAGLVLSGWTEISSLAVAGCPHTGVAQFVPSSCKSCSLGCHWFLFPHCSRKAFKTLLKSLILSLALTSRGFRSECCPKVWKWNDEFLARKKIKLSVEGKKPPSFQKIKEVWVNLSMVSAAFPSGGWFGITRATAQEFLILHSLQ